MIGLGECVLKMVRIAEQMGNEDGGGERKSKPRCLLVFVQL